MGNSTQQKLYHDYLKKKEKVDEVIKTLESQRDEILTPFSKKHSELLKKGGERTAKIDAEIKSLNAEINTISKDFETKSSAMWEAFYNDPIFVGKKEKLLSIRRHQRKSKTIAKRAVPVAGATAVSGIIAKILHKKDVNEQTTKQYYLEHSDYPKEYVDDFVELTKEAKNSSDPEVARNAGYFNTDGMTPTNFEARVKDGLEEYAKDILNDTERLEGIRDRANSVLGEFGVSDYTLTTEEVKETIITNKNNAIEYSKEALYAGYDPAQMAASVPDYTLQFAFAGAVLSTLLIFSPYIYNALKLRGFNKKFNAKKKAIEKDITKLAEQRDKQIAKINDTIQQKTTERDVVLKQEIEEGVAKLEEQKHQASVIVDLKISRAKAYIDMYYNDYLYKVALDGGDLAVSKLNVSKMIKVGKKEHYSVGVEQAKAKIADCDAKLDKLQSNDSTLV